MIQFRKVKTGKGKSRKSDTVNGILNSKIAARDHSSGIFPKFDILKFEGGQDKKKTMI